MKLKRYKDLIYDVISYCAWTCDTDKIGVKDKILGLIKSIKNDKIGSKNF